MKRPLLILLWLLGGQLPGAAQEAVSLEEALQRALAQSPAVAAAAFEQEASVERLRAARGLRWPQVRLMGGYTLLNRDIALRFNDQKALLEGRINQLGALLPEGMQGVVGELTAPLFQADWSFPLQERQLATLGAEVTIPIWLGGKVEAAIRVASLGQEIACREAQRTRQEVIGDLVERYYGVKVAQAALRLREKALQSIERHLADAERMEEEGMIAHAEVLYIRYKAAQAERDLESARLELATIREALKSSLGGVEIEPISDLFILDSLPDKKLFQAAAEIHNPLLQEVKLRREEAEEGMKVERAALMPEIVAVGGATLCHYQVSDLLPRWAIGVGLSWRLFDGWRSERIFRSARLQVERVTRLEEVADREIELLIEKRYNEVASRQRAVQTFEASLRFAEAYLATRRAAFREGVGSATELMDAELELTAVRVERMEAALRYCIALCRLMEAAGASERFIELTRCQSTHYIQ